MSEHITLLCLQLKTIPSQMFDDGWPVTAVKDFQVLSLPQLFHIIITQVNMSLEVKTWAVNMKRSRQTRWSEIGKMPGPSDQVHGLFAMYLYGNNKRKEEQFYGDK